jgi:hypothetical protein
MKIFFAIGSFVMLLVSLYFMARDEMVFRFRVKIIKLLNEKLRDCEDIRDFDMLDVIRGRLDYEASYDRMCKSFKPLRLEYWFTKEQVDYLKGGEENENSKS